MNMRTHLIVAALALAGVCFAGSRQEDPLQKKVSITIPATTMKNLMQVLEKETGVPFSVTPQTANDVMLVSVKDVTVQQLMDRIAQADGAEWVKDSAGYRLSRSQGLTNTQTREYLNARAAAIADAISKIKTPPANTGGAGAKEVVTTGSFVIDSGNGPQDYKMPPIPKLGETPVGRALISVLSRMNPNDLAVLGEGARVVYSSNPTRVQKAMPAAAIRDLQNFAAEHQAYVQRQRQSQTEVPPANFLIFGSGVQTNNEIKGGILKILVVFERHEDSPDITAQIFVADSQGNIAASASANISGTIPAKKADTLAVGSDEKAIELSDEAKLHARLMQTEANSPSVRFRAAGANMMFVTRVVELADGSQLQPAPKPTPELLAKILEPEKYDPLSFAASEFVLGMANGANIVASLPDSLLMTLSRRAATNTRPTELRNILSSTEDMEIESKDGWMIVKPRFEALARAERPDRLPAGQLLRSVNGKTAMTLDQAAAYAFQRGAPIPSSGFELPYLGVVNKQAAGFMNGQSPFNWGVLRLYGSMNVQQRRDMMVEGRVRASNLNGVQMAILDRMVYDEPGGPRYIDPNPQRESQKPVESAIFVNTVSTVGRMPGVLSMGMRKLMDERTEFLPTGVPRDAMLNLSVETQEGVFAIASNGKEPQFMSAEEYAMHNMFASQADPELAMHTPRYDRFIPAILSTLNFTFRLSPVAEMHRSLEDNRIEGPTSSVGYEQLPASFRDKVTQTMERMKAARDKMGNVRIGGGVKPPQ